VTVSVPPPNFLRVSDFLFSFHWNISTTRRNWMAGVDTPNSASVSVSEVVASPLTCTNLPSLAGFTASAGALTTTAAPSSRLRAV
jgi:hypothetical protein